MSDTFSNNRRSIIASTYSVSNYENINFQKDQQNQFISIAKKYNERIVKNMEYQRRMGMLYNYEIKNQHKVQKQLQHKEDKQRKTRKDKVGRNFTCGCQGRPGYLSYPALYTHIKTKHDGIIPEGTIRGVNGGRAKKRGRPKNRKTPLLYELDQQKNTFSQDLLNLVKRDKLKILNEFDFDVGDEDEQNDLQTKYFVQILKILKKEQKPNIKLMSISKLIAIFLYNCKDFFDVDALLSFQQMFYEIISYINSKYKVLLKNYQQRSDLFIRIDHYPESLSKDKKDQINQTYCFCQSPQFFPYFAERFIRQYITNQEQQQKKLILIDFSNWIYDLNLTSLKIQTSSMEQLI